VERAGLSARATINLLADAVGLGEAECQALPAARTLSRIHTSSTELPTGEFLGALPGGDLVGREAELARILAALDAAERGAGA